MIDLSDVTGYLARRLPPRRVQVVVTPAGRDLCESLADIGQNGGCAG
jgi:hypothetical protein